ncbi:MAG: acetolactate synthase small subunit [Omnitrophica bacterium GWA2_52_8]|nr:MAG: acetolactate synthase small subunit [Omnitrophica bacterium GWA2_52_8]
MKHTISVLVENHFGVLNHVSGLFSARGFNIDSLAVGETEDPTVSRMTIVATGDDRIVEQILKQLNKLIDVITVEDVTGDDMIDRELMLLKVSADQATRNDVMQVVNTFRAKVLNVSPDTLTLEVTGSESKVDAMLELLRPFGIRETVRTGVIALSRNRELKMPPSGIAAEGPVRKSASKKTASSSRKKAVSKAD